MSKDKKPSIPFTTPAGVCDFPYVAQPDTEGKFADGKYKVRIRVSDRKAALAAIAEMEEAAKRLHGTADGVDLPGYEDKDGTFIFTARSQFQPAVYDLDGDPVDPEAIGKGSILAAGGALEPYARTEGKGATKKEYLGLTMRLYQVLAVEPKRSAGGGRSMFDSSKYRSEGETSSRKSREEADTSLDI